MKPGAWAGVAVVTIAVLVHAAVPRYDWRPVPDQPYRLIRIDRWLGRAELGTITYESQGQWTSLHVGLSRGAGTNVQSSSPPAARETNAPRRPTDCSAKARAADPLVEIDCVLTEPFK